MRTILGLTLAVLVSNAGAQPTRAELVGFAKLNADTFATGPASGQYDGAGVRGATPRFASQPVQGFSGVQFTNEPGTYLTLVDNGFGSKFNSRDALLRLYRVTPAPRTATGGDATVRVGDFISLRDPDGKVPFAIVNENTPDRLLTGQDFDPESFVVAPDGTLWVGEEFGPYLLHFDATGKLLEAPIPTPNLTNLPTLSGRPPIVIGHRGASGNRPEHTLEAYALAIEQGADFVEPDLVVTKDGVLIARHEPVLASVDASGRVLEATTDVADKPEFKDRLTTKKVDGVDVRGWFAEDFTLAEIKTLKARERLPQLRGTAYDNRFAIPTFAEVVELVKNVEARTGRKIGVYPETKHPTYTLSEGRRLDGQPIGVNLGEKIVQTLVEQGFTDPARVFIQSFEVANLRDLKNRVMPAARVDFPLVQLLNNAGAPYDFTVSGDKRTYADLAQPEGLREIASYAKGAGANKRLVVGADLKPTTFVKDAHALNLAVHTWTMRSEPSFLAAGYANDAEAEMRQFVLLGVDGIFTDFPALGARVRGDYAAPEVRSPQNPAVLANSPAPSATSAANLPSSRGFEGMARNPGGTRLYPMLEGTVLGDPAGTLRIYEFDPAAKRYVGLVGRYRLESPGNAIGDFTVVNDDEYLVIERDNNSGDAARLKKIFKVNLAKRDADGNVEKVEVADLLNIADPRGLAPSSQGGTFRFPFVTIEDVLVLDANTILVMNDNNYPATGGRGVNVKDDNEMIWLRLSAPLTLGRGVGQTR